MRSRRGCEPDGGVLEYAYEYEYADEAEYGEGTAGSGEGACGWGSACEGSGEAGVVRRRRAAWLARRMCATRSTSTVRQSAGTYSRSGVPSVRGRRHGVWACAGDGPPASERRWRPGREMCRAGEKDLTVISWISPPEPGSACVTSQ